MAENTKIQWTDHTFNPWRGCAEVHAGCDNCYARTLAKRNPDVLGVWGPAGTRVVASEDQWRLPVKWNREAEKAGERRRVFCASLADVFENWKGPIVNSLGGRMMHDHRGSAGEEPAWFTIDDLRARLFRLIDATPNLDWQLVTKRPENVRDMWPSAPTDSPVPNGGSPQLYRHNVWLLTSISDQANADAMIPALLKCSDLVPVLGLSAEPLLGPVKLCDLERPTEDGQAYDWLSGGQINWVIIGGESGPGARPCNVAWIRDLVRQCKDAGVPAFVKQLGAKPATNTIAEWPDGPQRDLNGIQATGDKKGGDPSEWPADLQVREFPRPI